jgi:acyl-CoA dehydrogenase
MFDLDDRLRALRGVSAEAASELRAHALAVDADPHDMTPHLGVAAYPLMRALMTPLRFTDAAPRVGGFTLQPGSCLPQAVAFVELGYGDAGVVMACPEPGMAGVLVDLLGDQAQQDRFYGALAGGTTWTFFAVTEPARGNDASAMQTALRQETADLYRMQGTKRYIGNGSRGGIGVIFGRAGTGPLAIRAALVESGAAGFTSTALDMIGLRGACLGEIRLDDVPVPAEMLLGRHLPVARRGMWAAMRVFRTMRVLVAATAVGTCLALVDLVRAERPGAPGAAELATRLEACRRIVYAAGAAVDCDRDVERSSLAKAAVTTLGRQVSRWAVRSLNSDAIAEHPLLEKWIRDMCAYEFMEGTGDIQRRHIATSYLRGRRRADRGLSSALVER